MIVIMAPTVTAFPQLSALIHYEPIINSVNVGCNKHSDRNYHWIMIFIQVYLNRSGVINRRPCVGRLVLSFLQPLIGTKSESFPFHFISLWFETKRAKTFGPYRGMSYSNMNLSFLQFHSFLTLFWWSTQISFTYPLKSRHRNLFHWK